MAIEFTPMLSDMRKRVRVVMIVVAVAFVAGFLMSEIWRMLATRGSRRGPDTRGYIGQVGKHNITPEEYRGAVSYMTDKYKTDNRLRDLSNEDYLAVEQQSWKFLVSELTWAKVLKAGNVRVTQDEVLEIIKSNPPEDMRNRPELMTDGKFDQEKYLKIINAPENRAYFSKYFRELLEMLPKEKFRIDVVNAYRVTNRETEDALSAANTKWKTTSLYFGPKVMQEKVEPPEAEIRAWYDAHKEDFRTKETRQLRYVFVPLAVTRDDSAGAKETIDRAYNQLLKGETFNLTSLDYSDLDGETLSMMIPRAQLDKPTDSAVGRLKPGAFSPPFLAGYGWQIAMLDSTNKDSVAFRRILVRVKLGGEALATARDSVRSFVDKALVGKFDSVAAQFGLPVTMARPMVGGQENLAGLNLESPSQLVEWAKTAKAKQVLDRPQRGAQGYYVFELAEVKPAGVQEFEKVKMAASWRVRQDKEKQVWLAKANEAFEAIKAGKSLEQYAQENPGVELQPEEFSGLVDCRRKKGPEFAGAVAALNPGEKYGVIVMNWGAFIVRCDERTPTPTLEAATFAEQRKQQFAQELMQEMLKQPEVKDYRDALAY
jgi:peptidyl-prolyl cis-trans isomerase D